MATVRNLDWLRKQVAFKCNYDIDEPDQDIEGTTANPWYKVDAAINEAQDEEWSRVTQEGNTDHFTANETIVWPANQIAYVLPASIASDGMLYIEDITSGNRGTMLWVLPRQAGYVPLLTWQDRNTLVWRPAGPPAEKTLFITYVMRPVELVNAMDEPIWMPAVHRNLLVWSACCLLRDVLDAEVPPSWRRRLEENRWRFWNAMAQSKPAEPARQTIVNHDIGGVRRLV
jgi:hypothetical protein